MMAELLNFMIVNLGVGPAMGLLFCVWVTAMIAFLQLLTRWLAS